MTVRFTEALRAEYQTLFDTAQVRAAKAAEVDRIVIALVRDCDRYASVGEPLGIPWQLVAVIHNMEASRDFRTHLHNGDPLTARTRQVPAGRPRTGTPPFTWEESALDALEHDGLPRWTDWSVPGLLYKLEGYNGWGYRKYHPEVKSPYLWAGTQHYVSGKYVADGTWSSTAVSSQIGAATLLRRMAEQGAYDPAAVARGERRRAGAAPRTLFAYAPNTVTPGGIALQQWLNTIDGVFLREDGKLGPRTSDAVQRAFGFRLKGDTRA